MTRSQPLNNRADRKNWQETDSTVRLAKQEGTKLREEVIVEPGDGQRVTVDWDMGLERFRSWNDEQRETKIVVENERGEQVGFRTPNRYTPEYREMQYARSQSLERSLREEWGAVPSIRFHRAGVR